MKRPQIPLWPTRRIAIFAGLGLLTVARLAARRGARATQQLCARHRPG